MLDKSIVEGLTPEPKLKGKEYTKIHLDESDSVIAPPPLEVKPPQMNFEQIIQQESDEYRKYYKETCQRARLPLKVHLESITEQLMEKYGVVEINGLLIRGQLVQPYLAYIAAKEKEETKQEAKTVKA